MLITLVCMVVFIAVSYATKKPDCVKMGGLTFSTLTEADRIESRKTWTRKDVLLSVLLMLLIVLYTFISGAKLH